MQGLNTFFTPTYRNVTSTLEIIDVVSGVRESIKTFDHLIEAPEWMRDGQQIYFNSLGSIYSLHLITGAVSRLDTGFATNCNNDHVISPYQQKIAISHNVHEDGLSRTYQLPLNGGVPVLLTPIGPSYLHSWSPDGKTLVCIAYAADDVAAHEHPANKNVRLMQMPTEGGEPEVFAGLLGGQGTINVNAWAPDSRRLAFVSYALQ